MPTQLPTDLLEKLNDAEAKLEEASARDVAHDEAATALSNAEGSEQDARDAALAAHQDANAAAADAIAALKVHFGL